MSRYHRFYCRNCEASRRFRKPSADHRLHLKLTLGSLGLWSPVWLAMTLKYARRHWRCTFCRQALPEGSEEMSLVGAAIEDAWRDEQPLHAGAQSVAALRGSSI